ncbi:MAG: cytochrome c biogenesis protein DipZ [bacterium]
MFSFYWVLACFFAGFITFLSPCVLPVLPIVLSTSLGESKSKPFWIVLGLVLGFTALGISLNFLGAFLGFSPSTIRKMALLLLFAAGLLFLFPSASAKIFQPFTRRFGASSPSENPTGASPWAALAIGVSLGALWTPCAGPIFAFVLSASLLQRQIVDSFFLFLAYAVGAGLPMLAVAYLGNRWVKKIRSFARYENKIRRFSGALLILFAVFFWFGLDARFIAALPVSWVNLTKVEEKIVNRLDGRPVAPSAAPVSKEVRGEKSALPVKGAFPEIGGITGWINSDPLTRESLKGKVVLVDFWTYSCVNCLRTLPYLKQWYRDYRDQGFVVLGVHTPEFAFEKELGNVSRAVKELGILYPVASDSRYVTWQNFDNHYWPAHYLIDAQGNIRYVHFGEGEYDRTEAAIRSLLKEKGATVAPEKAFAGEKLDLARIQSPETYLGSDRAERFNSPETVREGGQNYSLAKNQTLNTWSLGGAWKIEGEKAVSMSPQTKLRFQFSARRLNLVLSSEKPVEALIRIDGKVVTPQEAGRDVKDGKLTIQAPRLYELIDLKNLSGEHLFEIEFLSPGAEAFAFTFG